MDNRPIGVFDSGIGGLTVVKSLIHSLPEENIFYVGDTARVPYGNKSRERIRQYSEQIVEWLINRNCKMIIIACNTASSVAIKYLKKKYSIPIIGVIEPGVEYATRVTKNKIIAILGTHTTIQSNAYGKKIKLIDPTIKIINKSCPLFVPLVEEGWVDGNIPLLVSEFSFEDLIKSSPDTVILGCTHYPLLEKTIKKVLGDNINLVDSGLVTANKVITALNKDGLNAGDGRGKYRFFVTDSPELFEKSVSKFLNKIKMEVKQIDLTQD